MRGAVPAKHRATILIPDASGLGLRLHARYASLREAMAVAARLPGAVVVKISRGGVLKRVAT